MPINKLIIIAVLLCMLLSVLTSGLLSATLDLCAFTLLVCYLFRYKQHKQE